MNTKQYAKKRGVSTTAVTQACSKGAKLIGVSSYSKVAGEWVLVPGSESGRFAKGSILLNPKQRGRLAGDKW
jgi:hypothetical protein